MTSRDETLKETQNSKFKTQNSKLENQNAKLSSLSKSGLSSAWARSPVRPGSVGSPLPESSRKSLAEIFFSLDSDRLKFRSVSMEAWLMAACFILPLLAFKLSFFTGATAGGRDAWVWAAFFSVAIVVAPVAFFWGVPAGIGTAALAAAGSILGVLFFEPKNIPWAIMAASALAVLAARLGAFRELLDGALAYWKLRQIDLEADRNVFLTNLVETEQRTSSLQTLAKKISQLSRAGSEIERSLSLPQIAQTVARQARDTFGRGRALLYRFDGVTGGSRLLAAFPACPNADAEFGDDYNPVVRLRRQNLLISDVSNNYQVSASAPSHRSFSSLMVVPLVTGYDVWGALRLESDQPGDFDRDDLRALAALSIPATLALQNADLFSAIEERAITDGLTGLYRRHFFDKRLEIECSRARRSRTTLGLIFFDIDHFKSINDEHGHGQGDIVLKAVAAVIAEAVKSLGLAARYGGEEFVVILPETSKAAAVALAEEIRRKMEYLPRPESFPLDRRITISGGVAAFPEDAASAVTLTERADAALYLSKKNGRNRITLA